MRLATGIGIAAFAIAAVVLSRTLSSYELTLATRILIFAIFAMSLDLLVGYTGLSSLGHAAFFGMASYTIGLLSKNVTSNLFVTMTASIAASTVLAIIFGALALRSRGVYFMMLTLALSQVVWGIALQWRSVTGGDDGLPGIPRPWIGTTQLTTSDGFYLFVLAAFLVSGALLVLVVHSPFGLTLQGIRESPSRMSALGYNVWLHQYAAFVIAGAFAGVAGALMAMQNGITSPASINIITGAEALLMVLLGGAGTMIGPFLGSVAVVLLEFNVSAHTDRWQSVLGVIYILVVIVFPRGIYPPLRTFVARLVAARRPAEQPTRAGRA